MGRKFNESEVGLGVHVSLLAIGEDLQLRLLELNDGVLAIEL